MTQLIETIARSMTDAKDLEGLRTVFHTSMSAFDLDQYTYQVVQHSGLHNMKNFYVTTYPKEWEQRYLEQNYFDTDPLVHQFQNSFSPFNWHSQSFTESDRKAQHMILEASDFNLHHGIGIPIPGPNKSFSVLTLSSKSLKPKELTEIYHHFNKDLLIAALMFHSSFLSLNLDNELHATFDLTNKELECLKWICALKSNTDIASILGVSVNAIKERNKSIFRKLGVYSRVEAICKAHRFKILDI